MRPGITTSGSLPSEFQDLNLTLLSLVRVRGTRQDLSISPHKFECPKDTCKPCTTTNPHKLNLRMDSAPLLNIAGTDCERRYQFKFHNSSYYVITHLSNTSGYVSLFLFYKSKSISTDNSKHIITSHASCI